jgi:hypothetical protein
MLAVLKLARKVRDIQWGTDIDSAVRSGATINTELVRGNSTSPATGHIKGT